MGQTGGDTFAADAAKAYNNKEYVKARYCYLKAYEAYVNEGAIEKAIPAAVNVSELYHREGFYKEAFATLNGAETTLANVESTSGKQMPGLHYPLAKERQKMYVKIRKAESARDWLNRMGSWAAAAGDSAINVDLLRASASVYYTFGPSEKGDEAVNKLVSIYTANADYDKADGCFRELINIASGTGNSRLMVKVYDKYMSWQDSVSAVKVAAGLSALQSKLDEANAVVADRDSSLTAKSAIIIGLIILVAILAGAIVFLGLFTLHTMSRCRKLKKGMDAARENIELKSNFIANISARMGPTLNALPAGAATDALKNFTARIKELSSLESTQTEIYPTESVNMAEFCESVADAVRPSLAVDVALAVNAPKMEASIAEEPLRKVLDHLLHNAAEHTPAGGKITLEFKKRGPHTVQFIVTDSGSGIDESRAAIIFQPFAAAGDIIEGDALGLPICAVMAAKMNGSITLDSSYNHGARFVVELHP